MAKQFAVNSNAPTMNRSKMCRILSVACILLFSAVLPCACEVGTATEDEIKAALSTLSTTAFTETKQSVKLLAFSAVPTVEVVDESTKTTKAYSSSTTVRHSTKVHSSTKGAMKSARKEKLKSSSSTVGVHAPHFQEILNAIDCELPVLPRESRLWRGNETHELNLPVTECAGQTVTSRPGRGDECPPVIVSWEGVADIQIGDILIVRISDSLLLDTFGAFDLKNVTSNGNSSQHGMEKHRNILQPAVYQVTRQGHEHCDVSEGMLLDITPLDEGGAKLFTLYDKDLAEGVNLLIVVSKNWRSKCVRLKVTVKSDNCGDFQGCSEKGVCYTNVSMEGYECQCCRGFTGTHCEERDSCHPSPCLNNGRCVGLSQPVDGVYYECSCIQGYSGERCEKDPCYISPCLNGGTCGNIAMNGSATYHCTCTEGWAGARCELSVAGGACASNPCDKGICVEQTDNNLDGPLYRCYCQPGYTGERCELEYNECESSPCANGGTCTDRVGAFECTCGRGYTGNTCQLKVDLCSPNPCPPRRYCMDRGNNYVCECPRGYVGDECHILSRSACDNNPCAHGGTCWSGVDSFYCSCRPGYTGKLCEEDFILESVISEENSMNNEVRGGGSVREVHMPLGLYHDRLHNVYIAAGTLGAAIAIVGIVVTACHCRVNKTYSRLMSRLSRVREPGPPHHWLQDKRVAAHAAPPPAPAQSAPAHGLDTADMYYTLDFSDSQSSPLIQ
ncbi:hypothetical protein ACJJTC_008045 [Scirpophaga incertulas]